MTKKKSYWVLLVPGHAADTVSSAELTAEGPQMLQTGGSRALLPLFHCPGFHWLIWVWEIYYIPAHFIQPNGCILSISDGTRLQSSFIITQASLFRSKWAAFTCENGQLSVSSQLVLEGVSQ